MQVLAKKGAQGGRLHGWCNARAEIVGRQGGSRPEDGCALDKPSETAACWTADGFLRVPACSATRSFSWTSGTSGMPSFNAHVVPALLAVFLVLHARRSSLHLMAGLVLFVLPSDSTVAPIGQTSLHPKKRRGLECYRKLRNVNP